MKSIEMTAKTTEEAISTGLEQLGVSISEVKVDIIEEGSKGLFGFFGSRPVKVRLTVTEEKPEDEVHEIFANAHASVNEGKAAAEKKEIAETPVTQPKQTKPAKTASKKKAAESAQSSDDKTEEGKKSHEQAREKKSAKKQEASKETKPVETAVQLDPSTLEGKAQDFLNNVTKLMGVDTQIHVTKDEEGFLHADMQGDTSGILIGRRGETLDALQHLTSLYINKGKSDYTRITLDTENYRARREDTLIRLANRYANRVVKTGRRVSVEPMNPYERRIMHSALQENEFVETHSEGEEPNRHIVITPRKQSSQDKAE